MTQRNLPTIMLPERTGNSFMETVPVAFPVTDGDHQRDLAEIERLAVLHERAMQAHRRKAEVFIDVNEGLATRSVELFGKYVHASETRVKKAQGTMFERDIQLAEHHFRQHHFDSLDAINRLVVKQTGALAGLSVLPERKEEPKKTWLERLLTG